MREKPIKIEITRHGSPIRQLAKVRTAKNAVEATACPDGKALYLDLKCGPFHACSDFTDGRARPVVTLMARPANPAIESAINIDRKMRVHFLFPRHQATAARISPSAKCSGQSPNRLTLRIKLRMPGFWCRA